jgi:integrase
MKLPKYVQAWVDRRDDRAYYYLRRRGFPRVRLPGLPWSPRFMAAYEAAMSGPRTAIGTGRIKPGSVAAVVAEYFDSQQFFGSKKPSTRRWQRSILERFRAAYGDWPFALLVPEWIEAQLDLKTPHAARSWLVTLRSLCRFALKRGHLRADPTRDIKLRAIKSDGFHTWTEDEIAAFEAHHPIGAKPRLGLALLLYTAQRRSDVVRMGRQHIKDGVLTVKQQKTGVTLAIPVHPHLQTVLDATPSEHLTFLVTTTGKPYGGNAFSEQFRNWCDAGGLPKRCNPPGLRKAACRRLAKPDAAAQRIMAISGHATLKELVRYTAADQARLARNAMTRRSSDDPPPRVHHAHSGAAAWPVAARAAGQEAAVFEPLWRLAFASRGCFPQGCRSGCVENQNVLIEYRYARCLRAVCQLWRELVDLRVDLIAAGGTPAARRQKNVSFCDGQRSDGRRVCGKPRPARRQHDRHYQYCRRTRAKRLELMREFLRDDAAIAILINQTIRAGAERKDTRRRPAHRPSAGGPDR